MRSGAGPRGAPHRGAPGGGARASDLDTYKQSLQPSIHAGCEQMSRVYMAAHFKAPVGLWGVICEARIRLLRDGCQVVFTHLHERRADAAKST